MTNRKQMSEENVVVEKEWKNVEDVHIFEDCVFVDDERIGDLEEDYKVVRCWNCYVNTSGYNRLNSYVSSKGKSLTCRLLRKGKERQFICSENLEDIHWIEGTKKQR